MVGGFIDAVRKYSESEGAARTHGAFVYKALKKVCTLLAIVPPTRSWDSRLGFSWFYEQYPTFPVTLTASRTTFGLSELFLKPAKMKILEELNTFVEENSLGFNSRAGIIIPSKKGLYILHNWGSIPDAGGYVTVRYRPEQGSNAFVFHSVDAFCKSVLLSGWSK